jgi:hypothetical protein
VLRISSEDLPSSQPSSKPFQGWRLWRSDGRGLAIAAQIDYYANYPSSTQVNRFILPAPNLVETRANNIAIASFYLPEIREIAAIRWMAINFSIASSPDSPKAGEFLWNSQTHGLHLFVPWLTIVPFEAQPTKLVEEHTILLGELEF